ncbi:hypothetical protein BDK51DRAFT_28705, partial [Blyttiomyces helicus]
MSRAPMVSLVFFPMHALVIQSPSDPLHKIIAKTKSFFNARFAILGGHLRHFETTWRPLELSHGAALVSFSVIINHANSKDVTAPSETFSATQSTKLSKVTTVYTTLTILNSNNK